jgi:hypothetical protein
MGEGWVGVLPPSSTIVAATKQPGRFLPGLDPGIADEAPTIPIVLTRCRIARNCASE